MGITSIDIQAKELVGGGLRVQEFLAPRFPPNYGCFGYPIWLEQLEISSSSFGVMKGHCPSWRE